MRRRPGRPASPMATRLTMPKPSISDSISRAARHAVAEVGAVGDDMDLRHRHGDAARQAGHDQQRLQRVGRQAERRPATGCATEAAWAASWSGARRFKVSASGIMVTRQSARRRAVGHPPAIVADHQLDDRRPDRARDVVARGGDGDGEAAPLLEPVRDVGDQRREGRGGAEADQHLGRREQDQRGGEGRERKARGEAERAHDRSDHDAAPVDQPPDQTPPAKKPSMFIE